MFRDRNGSGTNIVINLIVFIIFEGELHRKIHLNGIVMHVAFFTLTHFNAIKFILFVHLSSREAIM